jgi:hypothetical protein
MKAERRYGEKESALDTVGCDQVPVEERLQELTGRLINAQEKERRRIARELHDDLNQQLALLSINLEQLGQKLKKASNLHKQMQDLCARAREISNEVHRCWSRLTRQSRNPSGTPRGAIRSITGSRLRSTSGSAIISSFWSTTRSPRRSTT